MAQPFLVLKVDDDEQSRFGATRPTGGQLSDGDRRLLRSQVGSLACDLVSGARIDRRARFEQHDLADIVHRDRAMLDAMRDDDELALLDDLVPIAKLHQQAALVHQEQFVLAPVKAPGELARELGELDLHVVNLTGDLRRPGLLELPERVGQVLLVDRREMPDSARRRRE